MRPLVGKILVGLSVLAALAFYYARAEPWPQGYVIPLKGIAIALLALFVWLRHSSADARLLAIILGVAAVAEMALEASLPAAVLAWTAVHVIALIAFLPHRRTVLTLSQKRAAIALLVGTPVVAGMLPADPLAAQVAGVYGLFLGAMAAAAWSSSFPRYRVGAGAVLIVAAQLLIAAGLGSLHGARPAHYFPWPLTYFGLLLIATGAVATLRKRDPELRIVFSN